MLEEPQLQPFLLRTVWAPIMHPRPILPSWQFSNRKCISSPFELVKRESPNAAFRPLWDLQYTYASPRYAKGYSTAAKVRMPAPCPLGRLLFDENPFRRPPASWPNRYD